MTIGAGSTMTRTARTFAHGGAVLAMTRRVSTARISLTLRYRAVTRGKLEERFDRVWIGVFALVPMSAWAGEAVSLATYSTAVICVLGALLVGLGVFTGILWRRNIEHFKRHGDIQLQHAEITHAARLALIGEITASITHEVTQPLSAILSNVETAEVLLKKPQPDLSMVLEILGDIRNDEIRAHEIVRKLRLLLQKREVQMEDVDINALAQAALGLIRADAVRRHVEVSATLDPRIPHVQADPVHLQQVLLNLIINGMDAMEDTPIGKRRLDIQTVRLDRHIEVVVSDNGKGIEPANFSRLFKPFFTTKSAGMGVGLSITRSIIALHGGSIRAENGRFGGAKFRFTLPMAGSSSSQPRNAYVNSECHSALRGR